MIEVKLSFDTLADMQAFFATPALGAQLEPVATGGKKGGKKSKAAETEPQVGAGGSAADPLAGLLAPQSPMTAPATQPAVAAVLAQQAQQATTQVQTAPAEQPKAIEFKDVVAALTGVGKAKGRDALAAVLGHFGVTLAPQIPEARWAEAIAKCNQVLAA
jgi:hypothetical protein